jgi:hypothetical protein
MFGPRFRLTAIAAAALFPELGHAADTVPGAPAEVLPSSAVTAKRLTHARNTIQAQSGTPAYTINAAAIAATPGGDNTLLYQVLMLAPDVAPESCGQFHFRGEHHGLQYQPNGISLREGIGVFGQSLNPQLIDSMSLFAGALPAEYGLRTAASRLGDGFV